MMENTKTNLLVLLQNARTAVEDGAATASKSTGHHGRLHLYAVQCMLDAAISVYIGSPRADDLRRSRAWLKKAQIS